MKNYITKADSELLERAEHLTAQRVPENLSSIYGFNNDIEQRLGKPEERCITKQEVDNKIPVSAEHHTERYLERRLDDLTEWLKKESNKIKDIQKLLKSV